MPANDKAILTCALTGVLTDPLQHPVPVTPEQMAASAREAYNAGASIMHVHLQAKGQSLMGSDAMPGADATCGGYQPAQGLWVSIQADGVAEGRHLFDALAQGGQVVMPFEATFWSPGFGMARDRFGTPWMINVAQV